MAREDPFGRALKEALDRPERVVDLTSADGTPLRLEKHPEPDVLLRLFELDARGEPVAVRLLHFAAVDSRPAAYPESLPFVPGVATALAPTRSPKAGYICSWTTTAEDGKDPFESDERGSINARNASGLGRGRSLWERLARALGSFWSELDALQAIADRVIEASLADGWSLVERKGHGLGGVRLRIWRLEKAGRRRHVALSRMAPRGAVTLVEQEQQVGPSLRTA